MIVVINSYFLWMAKFIEKVKTWWSAICKGNNKEKSIWHDKYYVWFDFTPIRSVSHKWANFSYYIVKSPISTFISWNMRHAIINNHSPVKQSQIFHFILRISVFQWSVLLCKNIVCYTWILKFFNKTECVLYNII